jgi:hypothetical protein
MQTSDSRTADPVASRASAPRTSWIFFVVLGVVVVLLSTLGQFSSSVSGLPECGTTTGWSPPSAPAWVC